jgi:hypothetical protein
MLPGGGDRAGPGPSGGDFQGLAAPAAHEPGGCVEKPVFLVAAAGWFLVVTGVPLLPGCRAALGGWRACRG